MMIHEVADAKEVEEEVGEDGEKSGEEGSEIDGLGKV